MAKPWYHTTTIYQIYPRSFRDTNGDGVGDLQGVIQKLDYLRDMGFETLWISPFFASPQRDFGYDIADFLSISADFGGMEDALQLIDEVHKRGMRVVFDMVMNHTSDEHSWFKESRSSRANPRADWYIWRDKPNNWNSLTGGSGWHYAPERGQYYWASFLPFQPDLNYRNPDVKRAMFDTVRYWLGKGVDGFRLDIINVIYKDAEFRPNPFSTQFMQKEYDYSSFFQEAKYNVNQPETFEFVRELRGVCDEIGERMLVGEATAKRDALRKFLGGETNDGLGLMFDFSMLNFKFTAEWFRDLVAGVEAAFPEPFMPVYVFSNLDRRRSMSRLGSDPRKAKLLALLQFSVRGVPCTYYGEEIGMTDLPMPFASALDPLPHKYKFIPRLIPDLIGLTVNRDEVRTPMQWSAAENAGFTSGARTWLPVNPNYERVNVADEQADPASLLNTFRALLGLRKNHIALREGSMTLLVRAPIRRRDLDRAVEFRCAREGIPHQRGRVSFQVVGKR
jgi:alpha-glucosidase